MAETNLVPAVQYSDLECLPLRQTQRYRLLLTRSCPASRKPLALLLLLLLPSVSLLLRLLCSARPHCFAPSLGRERGLCDSSYFVLIYPPSSSLIYPLCHSLFLPSAQKFSLPYTTSHHHFYTSTTSRNRQEIHAASLPYAPKLLIPSITTFLHVESAIGSIPELSDIHPSVHSSLEHPASTTHHASRSRARTLPHPAH
jgi:hypothetical protein